MYTCDNGVVLAIRWCGYHSDSWPELMGASITRYVLAIAGHDWISIKGGTMHELRACVCKSHSDGTGFEDNQSHDHGVTMVSFVSALRKRGTHIQRELRKLVRVSCSGRFVAVLVVSVEEWVPRRLSRRHPVPRGNVPATRPNRSCGIPPRHPRPTSMRRCTCYPRTTFWLAAEHNLARFGSPHTNQVNQVAHCRVFAGPASDGDPTMTHNPNFLQFSPSVDCNVPCSSALARFLLK